MADQVRANQPGEVDEWAMPVNWQQAKVRPELQLILARLAIPEELDQGVAEILLADQPEQERRAAWQAFIGAARHGILHSVITEVEPGIFALSQRLRQPLLASWLTNKTKRRRYRHLNRELASYYQERAQELGTAAAQIDPLDLLQQQAAQAKQQELLRRELLCRFADDPVDGFVRFEELFQEYEWYEVFEPCERFFALANSFGSMLAHKELFWLRLYETRLARLRARALQSSPQERMRWQLAERQGLLDLLDRLPTSGLAASDVAELEAWSRMQLAQSTLRYLPLRQHRSGLDDPDLRSALHNFCRAADCFNALGSLRNELSALNNAALVYIQAGVSDQAVITIEPAIQRLTGQEEGQLHVLGSLLLNLGMALEDLAYRASLPESLQDAQAKYEASAEAFVLARYEYGKGLALLNLGRCLALQWDVEVAEQRLVQALSILSEIGAPEAAFAREWLQWLRSHRGVTRDEAQTELSDMGDTIGLLALLVQSGSRFLQIFSYWMATQLSVSDLGNSFWLNSSITVSALRTTHFVVSNETEQQARLVSEQQTSAQATVSYGALSRAQAEFRRGYFQSAAGYFWQAQNEAEHARRTEDALAALAGETRAWISAGELRSAIAAARRLLDRSLQNAHKEYQIKARQGLAEALACVDLSGRWNEIIPVIETSLQQGRVLGSVPVQIHALVLLGLFTPLLSRYAEARVWIEQAASLIDPEEDEQNYYQTQIAIARSELASREGRPDDALRYAEQALDVAQTDGERANPGFVASAQLILARVIQTKGDLPTAIQIADLVAENSRRRDWIAHEQEAQQLRSELLLKLGRFQEAHQAGQQALVLARAMPAKEAQVRALLSLQQSLEALGEPVEARYTRETAQRLTKDGSFSSHVLHVPISLQAIRKVGYDGIISKPGPRMDDHAD